MALKQLQVVTWGKSQLKWELLHEQHKQDTREDELIAAHNREIGKIWARTEKENRWNDVPVTERLHQAKRNTGWQAGGSVGHAA